MNWTEIEITTNSDGIEPLTGVLLNIGINGMQIQNAEDFNEFLEGTQTYWDYVDESLMALADCETKVTVYLPENSQGNDQFLALRQELERLKGQGEYGSLELAMKNVKEEDWENNWKAYFKPFAIGSQFLIKPTWETVENLEGRKILEIDPGMSFGTGTHETTQLCLEALETIVEKADTVLDLGCGSGILSIGAFLMGASHVTLVDIDQNSVAIAQENILKNQIPEECFTAHCGNVIEDKKLCQTIGGGYDVICANIVADVLKAMSGLFDQFLKSKGRLIVSGIITERRDEVLDTICAQGFEIEKTVERGYWSCAVLSPRADRK